MAKKTPLLKDGLLYLWDEYQEKYTIRGVHIGDPAEWDYWQEFLKNHKSLRVIFTEKSGGKLVYSVYKVKHPEEGHGAFWIAHKQVKGKLYRKYIGKNTNMTVQKLKEVAIEINQGKLI